MKNLLKKTSLAKLKIVLIAIFIGLGANYALATIWSGPTASAPGNNKSTVLNETSSSQLKGTGSPTGALLDVEGNLSGQNVTVWNNSYVAGSVYVNSLNRNARVCADLNDKLITCP
jgi:hypothetical protein